MCVHTHLCVHVHALVCGCTCACTRVWVCVCMPDISRPLRLFIYLVDLVVECCVFKAPAAGWVVVTCVCSSDPLSDPLWSQLGPLPPPSSLLHITQLYLAYSKACCWLLPTDTRWLHTDNRWQKTNDQIQIMFTLSKNESPNLNHAN